MDLFEKSLRTLELPTVLSILSAEASSEPAKEKARGIRPSADKNEVARRLGETTAAKQMIDLKGSPSFSGVKNILSYLARADLGGTLGTGELLDIAGVLRCARSVKVYYNGEEISSSEIDFLFRSLKANRFLEDKITNSIIGVDEIADSASAELADIRRHIRAAASRVRDALQKVISSPSYSKALQEAIITTRSDRYVVPVKAEYKGIIPGLVHDISASGATLFIEPMAAVKANNEIRELKAKEKTEIERILMELSADCAAHKEDISCDFNVLVALDMIFAKAKLSLKLDGTEPSLSDARLKLIRARHPLLDKGSAVPIDIELGGIFDTLVITGPNTGGKTVSLKTLGLLSVMAQCGLHIPASDGSCVPVYEKVLADIGDEQSIEQSLSTFSSHMTNIVRILREGGNGVLILLDELGAGTDPVEGAALAIAIIEYARHTGAVIAATTHYSELKAYATSEKGVQNASCEFDTRTLRPTYKLLIGMPGKSNAFAISERLGLPKNIIEDARSRVGLENANLENTIQKLEELRQQMEKDYQEVERKLRQAEENARKSEQLRRELSVRLEKADEKARKEAARIIAEAKASAEQVFFELDEMRRQQTSDEDHQRINEARSELRRKLNKTEDELEEGRGHSNIQRRQSSRPVKPGDRVEIPSMGAKASVIEVNSDRTLILQAGIMKITVKEEEVLLLEEQDQGLKAYNIDKSTTSLNNVSVAPEIDLRGMTADEALPLMERFIDDAFMGKLCTITIIHGKGTGALRKAVQENLRQNKQVRTFRLGRYGEGETGVTVVELK